MKIRLLVVQHKFIDFKCGMKNIPIPMTKKDILFPPEGAVKLAEVPKEPPLNEKIGEAGRIAQTRRYIEARGGELIHNQLTYKQFGLAAVTGGFLTHKAFEYLRSEVNKNLRNDQFAIWRVDPPWLPRTQRSAGKKMGGGRPGVKFYVTPVKANRIILEIGGLIDEYEARGYLSYLSTSFKFPTEFVSQRILEERKQHDEEVKQKNLNKFNWETIIKWNMQNCSSFLSDYDIAWKCKYR